MASLGCIKMINLYNSKYVVPTDPYISVNIRNFEIGFEIMLLVLNLEGFSIALWSN